MWICDSAHLRNVSPVENACNKKAFFLFHYRFPVLICLAFSTGIDLKLLRDVFVRSKNAVYVLHADGWTAGVYHATPFVSD